MRTRENGTCITSIAAVVAVAAHAGDDEAVRFAETLDVMAERVRALDEMIVVFGADQEQALAFRLEKFVSKTTLKKLKQPLFFVRHIGLLIHLDLKIIVKKYICLIVFPHSSLDDLLYA